MDVWKSHNHPKSYLHSTMDDVLLVHASWTGQGGVRVRQEC